MVRVTSADLDLLEPKECYSVGEVGCTRTLIEMSSVGQSKDSICLGFMERGLLYGIAGSYRNWMGSAQAWAVFDGKVNARPIGLTKICKSLIEYARKEQELKRLSLTVRSGYTKGDKFAKTLGFEQEGVMRKYLPDGGDANLYARLF